MSKHTNSLRQLLYQIGTGGPQDGNQMYFGESEHIDKLTYMVEGMEMGDYTYGQVRKAFREHGPLGFDFEAWFQDRVNAGDYFTLTEDDMREEPEPEEDLPENVIDMDAYR